MRRRWKAPWVTDDYMACDVGTRKARLMFQIEVVDEFNGHTFGQR